MRHMSEKVLWYLIFALWLANVVTSEARTEDENAKSPPNRTESARERTSSDKKWIKAIFLEAEKNFDMDDVSVRCKTDFQRYKMHLKNQTVWAVRMFESSEWPYVGLFSGKVDHWGNYDECLMVSSHGLRGQYCLAEAVFDFPANSASVYGTSVAYQPDEEASVWDTLQMYQRNPIRISRQKLSWAVCIPSSCRHVDLRTTLNRLLPPLFRESGLNITVDVNPILCSVKESSAFPAGFYAVSAFIVIIFMVGITSAIFDYVKTEEVNHKENDTPILRIICEDFSIVRNFRKLIDVSSAGSLASGHLFKVEYMCLIIYGHRLLFLSQIPIFNIERTEVNSYPSSWRLTNLMIVDSFFFISGFLTFHYGFKPMKKLGGKYLILSVITRWIRMVPLLCMVHLFVIYIIPYLSDGPLWNQRFAFETENCKSSFWANFFSISNIMSADKPCLIVSWYTAVDIQLTIIGSIILLILAKNEKLGICFTSVTFVASCAATFAVVYFKHYHGMMLTYFNFMKHLQNQEEFNHFYNAFYTRIPPYLLGFVCAFLVKRMVERKQRFSAKYKTLILAATLGIKISVGLYGTKFYAIETPYNPVENGIFAASSRWLYVMFEFSVYLVFMTSDLGLLGKIFTWKVFIPFGRLTYSVFLTNTVLQMFHIFSQRTVFESHSFMNEYWWTITDIYNSYLLGLLLHVFLEAPLTNISKRFVQVLFSLGSNQKKSANLEKPSHPPVFVINEKVNGEEVTEKTSNRVKQICDDKEADTESVNTKL